MAETDPLLYAEADGMVYLVERDGRHTFPRASEVPFEVGNETEMEVDGTTVVFAIPDIDEYPTHWAHKDEIPARDDVDPLVRRAVNATLTREVSGAVLHRGDPREAVLMVKSSRGFTKGMWNIPGGFLTYGETPRESVRRELKEETNLDIEVKELLGVYSERFGTTYFMRGFMYLARRVGGTLDLNPSEIADATWMPLEEARETTHNPFASAAMGEVLEDA
jgi:ADP-ribose pyrophosphatase YjhB (NUDIX family)